MGPNCQDCTRPMRPSHKTADDMPGTVRHQGLGYCGSCYTRRKRRGTLPDKPKLAQGRSSRLFTPAAGTIQCEGHGCTRTLRPHGAHAEDWPGTFARKAQNRCSGCYETAFRERDVDPGAVARTAETLSAYLAWRRPFRAKAGAL